MQNKHMENFNFMLSCNFSSNTA